MFTRLDDTYEGALDAATETLSVRYAMDFRAFHAAGVRHLLPDLLGPYEDRNTQIERFAAKAMPLWADLTGAGS